MREWRKNCTKRTARLNQRNLLFTTNYNNDDKLDGGNLKAWAGVKGGQICFSWSFLFAVLGSFISFLR